VDVEKLIGEVAARNGIRIEPDDPAFALVTLNQLVLEEAIKNLVTEIRAAIADFESAAERVQNRVGTILARETMKQDAAVTPGRRTTASRAALWFCVGASFGAVLLVISAWFGHLGLPCG
jgi:hypothetical protein